MMTMHHYATDSDERKTIPAIIAFASILAALLLYATLKSTGLVLPWWLDVPSVVGFYGLFYQLFERRLWRANALRRIGLTKVPDLNGEWKGYLSTSYEDFETKIDAHVEIFQSWTQVEVILRTQNSESHSLMAAIFTERPEGTDLHYEYHSEPKVNAEEEMHEHRGTARLALGSNGKVLHGDYYCGRDRRNLGILHFERIEH